MPSQSRRDFQRVLIACGLCLAVSVAARAEEPAVQLAQKADLGELREMSVTLESAVTSNRDWIFELVESINVYFDKRQVGTGRNVKPGDSIPISLGRGLEFEVGKPIDIELILSGLNMKSTEPPEAGNFKLKFRWGWKAAVPGDGGAMISTASEPVVSDEELKWRKGWKIAAGTKKGDDGVASSYVYSEPTIVKKQIEIRVDEKTKLDFEFSN